MPLKMKANAVLLHSCEITSGTPKPLPSGGLYRVRPEYFGEMSSQFEQIGVIRPYVCKIRRSAPARLVKRLRRTAFDSAYNQPMPLRGPKLSAVICG